MALAMMLLVAAACPAQDQAIQEESSSRFRFGISVAPGLSYRTLIDVDKTQTTSTIIGSRNEREEPRMCWSAALFASYRLSERFALESGIGYALLGWQVSIDRDKMTFGDWIYPRRDFTYSVGTGVEIPKLFTFRDNFHYAIVPLRATISLGNGRWRWISGLGMEAAFLLEADLTSVFKYDDGSVERERTNAPEEFRPFGVFAVASTGANWSLTDRIDLRAEPTVRYGLTRLVDAPISAHLWSAGLSLGCSVRW